MVEVPDFGPQIIVIFRGYPGDEGQPLGHLDPVAHQAVDFVGVVGEQADGVHPKVPQDEGGDFIIPLVGVVAQGQVGLHRVETVVLEVVSLELFDEADAPAFLAQVEEDPPARLGDHAHGQGELFAAVAAARAQDVAGEALGMEPDQDLVLAGHFSHDQGQVLLVLQVVLVKEQPEFPPVGGDAGHRPKSNVKRRMSHQDIPFHRSRPVLRGNCQPCIDNICI